MRLCRACTVRYSRQWPAENPDKVRENRRRAEKSETRRRSRNQWRAANPDKVSAQKARHRKANAEKVKSYLSEWKARNPDKSREYAQRYVARKVSATVEIFSDLDVFERDSYICYLCNEVTDISLPLYAPKRTILEHRVPLSRGGDHSMENCATACWECNSRKNAKTDTEYLALLAS